MANLVEALTDVSKSSDLRETLRATRAAAIFAEQEQLRKTDRAHAAGKAEGKLEAKREIAATLLAQGLTREAVEAAVTTQLADLGL
jgi:predicted transposase YdaD